MILPDVNVLVKAHRSELQGHSAILAWLDSVIAGQEPFGISQLALSAFVRIVTLPAFRPPSTPAQAFAFCGALLGLRHCRIVRPGAEHWSIFERICKATGAAGKLVPDAYYAAMAIEHGCEWITTDGDFVRFPGLRWSNPVTGQSRTNPP